LKFSNSNECINWSFLFFSPLIFLWNIFNDMFVECFEFFNHGNCNQYMLTNHFVLLILI
jgi:hypothetical protein